VVVTSDKRLSIYVNAEQLTPTISNSQGNLLLDPIDQYTFYIGNNLQGKGFKGYIYSLTITPEAISDIAG